MKCKNCGTVFQKGIFCPECGTKFREKIFCPECGTELLGRNFCTECGTRIRRDTSTPVSEQSNNDNLIKEKIAIERAEHEAEMERQKTESARLEKERIELEINPKKAEQEQAEEFRIKGVGENRQESASKYESEKKVENEGKTMAILSLICGILSLLTMGAFFVSEILGIVFACLGKKQGKMRGQAIAGLICSILSLVIIIAMVIVRIISPSGSDGDLRNNTSVVDEEFSGVVESASDEQYRDGVSDEYLSYLFQMDTEAIIQEYHEKGYEYVWLTSHVVKAPENGTIGDPGTVDSLYLEAAHVDSDGYFSITVTYGVVYCYWGKEIGWKNNFEGRSVVDFDFSAFNDSYWRITDKNRLLTLADSMVEDIPTNDQGEISAKQIDGYITFTNFDTFKYVRDFEFASEYVLGKIVVIVDGCVYEMDIICDYYAYGHKMRLLNGYDAWDIGLEIDTYSYVTGIHWSSDSTSEIQRITQQEFEAALGGVAVNIQETDGNNHELNSDEIVDKYGTYSVDNGIDANLEADVGVYTDEDGGDYIWLGALSYGGRYLVEYEGVLVRIEGNVYEADDGYGNKLECVFDEGGMSVTVISVEFTVFYTLEGYYFKTEGINFDEVG